LSGRRVLMAMIRFFHCLYIWIYDIPSSPKIVSDAAKTYTQRCNTNNQRTQNFCEILGLSPFIRHVDEICMDHRSIGRFDCKSRHVSRNCYWWPEITTISAAIHLVS
jgi:hypothetical protein